MATKTPSIDKNEKIIKTTQKAPAKEIVKCKMTTRIQVKCDVGFGNHLTIRGQGTNLSWDKGIPLKNLKDDEWIFETDDNFSEIEFKILINDLTYEIGQNHIIKHGNYLQYHPKF
jgi:hypothetical protein